FAGSSCPLSDCSTPHLNAGVEFLVDQSRSFTAEEPLTVLGIGAVTDIASALIFDPTMQDRIEIVAMGFQSLEAGGDEWNVKNDARAWQVLLNSSAKITIGDAAVCKRHLMMTAPQACELFEDCGKAGQYLITLISDWLHTNPRLAEMVSGRS